MKIRGMSGTDVYAVSIPLFCFVSIQIQSGKFRPLVVSFRSWPEVVSETRERRKHSVHVLVQHTAGPSSPYAIGGIGEAFIRRSRAGTARAA